MKSIRITEEHKKAGIFKIVYHDQDMDAYLCVVDPRKIIADPLYQRSHDESHSDRMKGKEVLVWPYPICNFRNKRLRVLDGQHRTEVSKKKARKTIHVVVKFGLSVAQEAASYAELNTMKRPNSWNQFKARLTAKDPKFVAMKNCANNHGLTLKCDYKPGDLRNVHVMIEAFEAEAFEPWIKLLCAFKNEQGRLLHYASTSAIEFQRGLLDLIRKYGAEIASPTYIGILRRIGLDMVRANASDLCNCGRTSRSHYLKALESLIGIRTVLPLAA